MFKRSCLLTILNCLCFSFIYAGTLQETVVEVLNTNPLVQERLKNFRATQQDLNIAESEYYPSIDLSISAGYNKAGDIKSGTVGAGSDFNHNVAENDYKNYETSLTLTQNIFDGFSTMHKIDFEEAQILASAYKYLEKSNDIAFQMTDTYIKVMRSAELVGTAQENVQINESIYSKVNDLFESGLTTDSEVKKIQATLSLARSNLTVQKNNATDAEYQYRRVLGRLPDIKTMQKPHTDTKLPTSIEKAALYAVQNNPSLFVSRYNIEGAEALYKQSKKDYYPKIDLEISQTFNDNDQLGNGFDQADDRFQARLVLNYNLFRGGADSATVQQRISKVSQEIEIQRDLKRQVIEGLDLSWNAYYMLENQLRDLRDYSQYSETTLELYKEEYDLGRRSLLDLLSAQNDVINSRSQIIGAEYDQLFAKYRILDAMGLLVVAVNGTADEFTSKVNLYTDDDMKEVLDIMDVDLDLDKDQIAENIDLCDNSLDGNNIMPYGCIKIRLDDDKDGVFNEDDDCPLTALGVEVQSNGCKIEDDISDSDSDGVIDSEDVSPNTPIGYSVNESGIANLVTLSANFEKNSANLPDDLEEKIIEFSEYLKAHPDLTAEIVGHTSKTKISKYRYNINLSIARAKRFRDELVNVYGIDTARLSIDGKGYNRPIADNLTLEGRTQNRRVEITLFKDGEKI